MVRLYVAICSFIYIYILTYVVFRSHFGPTLGRKHAPCAPESVNEGHPDKVCDQVSDSVLDTCLTSDPKSKVACETATKDNMVMVAGEITTQAKIDYEAVVRGVEPYTKDGIKFFEWENAKDLSKFKGMSSAQVAAEVVEG